MMMMQQQKCSQIFFSFFVSGLRNTLSYNSKCLPKKLWLRPDNTNLRGSITVRLTPHVYFVWIQLFCLWWMNKSFTCLVKYKSVQQEVSCTYLTWYFPPPPVVSVLCWNLTVLRLVHMDCVKCSRIGQFNACIKRAQIENYLSYCINACDLRRSERAFTQQRWRWRLRRRRRRWAVIKYQKKMLKTYFDTKINS